MGRGCRGGSRGQAREVGARGGTCGVWCGEKSPAGETFQGFPGGQVPGEVVSGAGKIFRREGRREGPKQRSDLSKERSGALREVGLRGCQGLEPGTSGCGRVSC